MEYNDSITDIELMARKRFSGGRPDSDSRRNRYEHYHRWYAPPGGDQWPEDLLERPEKIHITANIVKRFCDTEARLLSIMPRITIETPAAKEDAKRSEVAEKAVNRYLVDSGIKHWYFVLEQSKSIYGMGVLKPFWNTETKQPDVVVVEQPQNIMFGWGDSDYNTLDWAIYHYGISPLQAKIRYPDAPEICFKPNYSTPAQNLQGTFADHYDPLNSMPTTLGSRVTTNYEHDQVQVWDYWYLDEKGVVTNCTLLNGYLVDGPHQHEEMPALPYIPIEHDHEPGSPEGRGTAELLIDIQDGLNRAMSHYAQYVWDNSDPAYQLVGEGATNTVPDGLVPRPGEIVAPGQNTRIELINMGVNNFPFDALVNTYWNMAHRLTGLSEILFGAPAGGDATGRATIMQIESSINAIEPKRDRSYEGLRTLLSFWHFMLMKKNPVLLEGDEEKPYVKAKDVFDGLNNWRIIAPEITPRNIREHTQNIIDKMNARIMSTRTAMAETGIENPMEELDIIREEATDAHLYPERAQAIAAVAATMQALAMQEAQMAAAQNPQGAAQEGQADQEMAMAQRQQAQPTLAEDQNQIAAGANGIPPGDASPIGGQFRPIVRQSPGADGPQSMSEIRLPVREF